uniref:40S ribosomal protein S26 n=1 Tax=Amorphochlora amoebiformis TaxID=1561963 RepID=A0A0H5BKJ8_9EUKA|nr:ribosomal protein S26 [Amorphochlora amoebiformis]
MVKKRRNCGRSKHNQGYVRRVHCMGLNTLVPRDKAIKKLNIKNFTDSFSIDELNGAILLPSTYHFIEYEIPKLASYVFYSISYAFGKKIIRSREKSRRKLRLSH